MVERYKAPNFNARPAPEVAPRVGPDLRGLQQFGQSLGNYLDAKAYREAAEQGYQEQIGSDDYVGGDGRSFWNPAEAAGRQKGARVAYGARKEMQLKRSLLDLEQKFRLDPQGFRDAADTMRKDFFRNAPVEILPQMQEMFDRSVFRVEAGIFGRKAEQDRANEATDILANMDDLIQSTVRDTLLNGPSQPHADQIKRWQGFAAQMVRLGHWTPKQRESAQRQMEFQITQANAISRVRRGERAQRIAQDIQDPRNPTYSVLRVDQQQRLLADLQREESLRERGLAGERSLLGDRFQAQLQRFRMGKVPETPEAAVQLRETYQDRMIRTGVPERTIEKNLRRYDQELVLGNEVRTLNLGTLIENQKQLRLAQNEAASYRGADPLEQDRLSTRVEVLQQALARKQQMIKEQPIRAAELYNPRLYRSLGYEDITKITDRTIVEARKKLQSWTGDPNTNAIPVEITAGIQGQLAAVQTAQEKGLVLGSVVMQFPDQADEIFHAAGLTRTDLMAANMMARGESVAAQQLLLARQDAKANKTAARDDDVETAFAAAFGEQSETTLFDDYREPFADLYRHFVRNAGDKAAGQLAFNALMRNKQLVRVGGNPLILDKTANPEGFESSLEQFKQNLIRNGVVLGTDPRLSVTPRELRDLLDDSRKWHWEKAGRGWAIRMNDGRGVYVQTKSGRALAIFDPVTGRHNIVPSDPNTKDDQALLEDRNWGRPVRVEPQVFERTREIPADILATGIYDIQSTRRTTRTIEEVETTAERAFSLGIQNGLTPDRFIGVVRKNPERYSRIAGASFATLSGDLPDWAVETLANSGVTEFKALDNPDVLEIVRKLWSDPDERLKPINGRIPEPSESLAIITERARQVWIKATYIAPRFTRSPIAPSKKNSSGALNTEGIDKISFDRDTLTPAFDAYESALFQRESGGDYTRLERRYQGHAGAYQMSPAALVDAGLMKPEAATRKLSKKAILEDKSLWNIQGGLKTFLARPDLQDQAFREFTRKNLQVLVRNGTVDATTPIDEVMGWLAVAHLLGASSAKRAKSGELVAPDGNGTTWEKYFRLGQDAAIRAGKAIDL